MSNNGKAIATQNNSQQRPSIDGVESALVEGDLGRLTPEQRITYYEKVCDSVGLNPLTKPFAYIRLNGKLTLYAKRDAAEQLRAINGISITKMETEQRGDIYIVRAYAEDSEGRTDVASGAVDLSRKSGEALANAYMKAETKAKRRVTLSMGGLGWLDETEVADIPNGAAEPVSYQEAEQPAQLEESTAKQPTWRGEAINPKQIKVLEKLEQRFDECDTPACTFDIVQKAQDYASKWPEQDAQRIHTIIQEQRARIHIFENGVDRKLLWDIMQAARDVSVEMMVEQIAIVEAKTEDLPDEIGEQIAWALMPYQAAKHLWSSPDPAHFGRIMEHAHEKLDASVEHGHYSDDVGDIAQQIIYREAHKAAEAHGIELEQDAKDAEDLFGQPAIHNDQG